MDQPLDVIWNAESLYLLPTSEIRVLVLRREWFTWFIQTAFLAGQHGTLADRFFRLFVRGFLCFFGHNENSPFWIE
jgi:hypothetical protein